MLSGEPPRGTELLCLTHCNEAHGRRRNIFIENGLVTFVTFCLKGYSMTESTKIIHRYLPQEVSELIVYYLWLILPFTSQLKMLAMNAREPTSPYLWAAKELKTEVASKTMPMINEYLPPGLKAISGPIRRGPN
jgi:hypothetical protein